MGSHPTYDDLGAGLHFLREHDPLKRAGSMAVSLRADLCATLPQAEAVLAERAALPLIDGPALATLHSLARRLARAERVAARTRERAEVEVGSRLSGAAGGLAVHPTTIRDRAAAVAAAQAALAAAEQALLAHAEGIAAAEERAAAAAARAAEEAAVAARHREDQKARALRSTLRRRRSQAMGLIVAAFGLGLVLLGLGAPLWGALLPPFAASLVALRHLRTDRIDGEADDLDDREEATSLLMQISATAGGLLDGWECRELDERQSFLTANRDRAREDLRVAEHSWHDLAGDGVPISELEDVVRRFDPQHEDARLLAGETVGVRSTEVVLHHFRQRWLAFWRELGRDAPSPEAGEQAVEELAATVARAVVLVGPATALATALARAAPAAAVVVLDGAATEPEELS